MGLKFIIITSSFIKSVIINLTPINMAFKQVFVRIDSVF